jgi:hypothetical protein
MTGFGIFGLLLTFAGAFLAFRQWTRLKVTIFAAALLMHLGSVVLYHSLVGTGGGDSVLYYYDPDNLYAHGLGMSTQLIVWIVQTCKVIFGGTYFDYFIVFGAFGFYGIALLMRIIEEVFIEVGGEPPFYVYLIVFLPGVHYWTSAIGKDSLFFFAMMLALWASMQIRRRYITVACGMILMLLIRPHIAVIALAALGMTIVADRRASLALRVGLGFASVLGTAGAIAATWSAFQIDLTNIDVFSDALAGREALVQTEAAGRTAVDASYPVRVAFLLFRPLFVDANGALGLVVSMENAVLLLMFAALLFRLRTAIRVLKSVAFARFALMTFTGVLLVLAIGYYNVGLGIRQKSTMILPGLLVFFIAVQGVLKARRRTAMAVQGEPGAPAFA